jgi:putative oxidoreductase
MINQTFDRLVNPLDLIARLFIGYVFISAGVAKIGAGFAGTQGYMEAMGVPGGLLYLVIVLEIGAGALIAIGFFTRPAAFLLAGFCVIAGFIFHYNPEDQMQMIMLSKNIAIAGGLLVYTVNGVRAWSVDGRRDI